MMFSQILQTQTFPYKMASAETHSIIVRHAEPGDCEEIMRLIIEFAQFEKQAHQVENNADALRKDLFCEKPVCFCLVACPAHDQSKLIGYTTYFNSYSTWKGVGVNLDDLYVIPSHRGKGLGKRLVQTVTKIAVDKDCSYFQLTVLAWNSFAKDFYHRCGFIDLTSLIDRHVMELARGKMEALVKDFKINL